MLLENTQKARIVGDRSETGLNVTLNAGIDKMGDVLLGKSLSCIQIQRLLDDPVGNGKVIGNIGGIDKRLNDGSKRVGNGR